jgi:hypothetical protein
MAPKGEFVGTVQFWPNGVRGNPVGLFMEKLESGECRISTRLPKWRHLVGIGATVNKAAGNYELNLKAAAPAEGTYEGPYWNGGIKAEKPAPPKPVPVPSSAGGGSSPAEPGTRDPSSSAGPPAIPPSPAS